ncbi:MAG: c-type heme family protein [Myxococcota bacterium]
MSSHRGTGRVMSEATRPTGGAVLSTLGALFALGLFLSLASAESAVTTASAPAEPSPPSASPVEEEPSRYALDPTTGFVIDEGWELVASQCTACHSAKLVQQNRGDEAHWLELIRWMQKTQNLWPFAPDVEKQIIAYLAKHYGAVAAGRRPPLPSHLLPPDEVALADELPPPDPRLEKAQARVAALKKALLGELQGALAKGGPVAAIEVCRQRAPALAAAYSDADVVVGRTSHRLRNPANAPREWVTPLLFELLESGAAADVSLSMDLEGGGLGYIEAIPTGPLCLTCHGKDLAADVRAAITQRYPVDEATGFAPGQLRGVFWAETSPLGTVLPTEHEP